MANFNLEQSKKIYQDAQSKGLDPKKVIYLMAKSGSVFDGVDMNGVLNYGKKYYEPKQTVNQEQMSPEQADKFLNKSTVGQIFSKETAQELPKAAYETLVGNAAKFVKSAVEAPVNIVQGLQGKEMTTANINDPVTGKPIGSFQTDFQNKILPAVESGQISPLKGTVQAVGGPILGAADVLGAGELVPGGTKLVKSGAEQGSKLLTNTKNVISDIIPPGGGSGVGQIASDLVSRVPRAGERVKEAISTASERAAKMKTATPQVKQAMKSNLDERIINTIESSDNATKKAFKDVVDIAGEKSTKIGTKKQPTIIGGELATKQFELINKAKQEVGKKLGDAVKSLDRTTNVNVTDAFQKLDNTLSEQGIIPTYDTKGVKLDFTGSRYTPAERTKIQELYDLATEGGDTLTPSKIREKDQLFSKLKRQSQYEGVGDIIVDTADGQKSLFNVFRDVYSSKLDEISPEIKKLNSEYAKYKNLTDDIEDSIFKTPNFNVTKSTDPAEFAKVNLRRIFGESQSSPVYESIADIMDSTSRGLGYKGASPKVVAEFAQEMRKLFPDTIPSTGFSGGIKLGVGDIVEKITSVGATNLTDQQKAVRDLLQSYFKDTKGIVKPIKKNGIMSSDLSTGVKKYKSAEDFEQAVKKRASTAFELQGESIKEISIIGSTANGKLNPNDLDILITPTKKRLPTTSENIHTRKEFNDIVKREIEDLFPGKKVHVTVSEYDIARGRKMSLKELWNKANKK